MLKYPQGTSGTLPDNLLGLEISFVTISVDLRFSIYETSEVGLDGPTLASVQVCEGLGWSSHLSMDPGNSLSLS